MSITVTNMTKYPSRALSALWSAVVQKSYHEVLPKGRGGAILAEKEATASKLGARVPNTRDSIVGRYQQLCERDVRVVHSNDGAFTGMIGDHVRFFMPPKEVSTARVLRRMRFMVYAELLGDSRRVPVGIAENAWSTVDAAAQTFPALMKKYGPELRERLPKARTPKVRSPHDEVVTKLDALDGREKAWRTKAKRAATALKNIERERKQLQRRLAKLDAAVQADAVLAEARS